MREHDSFLGRLEETLARMSSWIADRRRGSEQTGARRGHGRFEALRSEITGVRRSLRESRRADLARVRATLEDLHRDYESLLPHTALTRAELDAMRRHLHTTARLMRDLSDLDSPNWNQANEEYERSWAEVERAYSGSGTPTSP